MCKSVQAGRDSRFTPLIRKVYVRELCFIEIPLLYFIRYYDLVDYLKNEKTMFIEKSKQILGNGAGKPHACSSRSTRAKPIFFPLSLALWASCLFLSQGFAQAPNRVVWNEALEQPVDWYGSDEAKRIAENVLIYQNNNGGWPKNIEMASELSKIEVVELEKAKTEDTGTTIDNDATYTQMRYLAKVYEATGEQRFKTGFVKGLDFLLQAQYDQGGWPQYYPVRKGYYGHITFNDGAMIGVMRLLRDVANETPPYTFVGKEKREKAQQAIDNGLRLILKLQIEVDGKLTAWCAQHDKEDGSPVQARTYELPSISGGESVGILEYLMEIPHPSHEVKKAIQSAVEWFEEVRIEGFRIVRQPDPSLPQGYDIVVEKDPQAPPLWARFYEIGTNRPMFVGRNGVVKYRLSEIEHERRVGYSYLGHYAEKLLKRDYPKWKEKWQ